MVRLGALHHGAISYPRIGRIREQVRYTAGVSMSRSFVLPVLVLYVLIGLTSCFDPHPQEGLACTQTGACPSGQDCFGGVCFLPGNKPPPDAQTNIDATSISCITEALAIGQMSGADLDASDATHVYWTDDAGFLVLRSAKLGGATESFQDLGDKHPHGIASDDTYVYWSENDVGGRIMRKAKAALVGDPPEVLATAQDRPTSIVLDDVHVFWTTHGDNSIRRILKVGGTVEQLTLSQSMPDGIVLDEDYVFFLNFGSGQVLRVTKEGSQMQQLAGSQGQLSNLGLSSDSVYWTDATAGEVRVVGKQGGSPTAIASGQNNPGSLALSADAVYWSNESGQQIVRHDLSTGNQIVVTSGQADPVALTTVGNDIYWLDNVDADTRLMHASCNPL